MRRLRTTAAATLLALAAAGPPGAGAPTSASGEAGMVVTDHRLATEVGAEILARGGNAVDAAVAVGYALAVVYPCCGNLGGGGFLLLRLADGREVFLDFREAAPRAAAADMFLGEDGEPDPERSRESYLATGVPGTVLGLETARERYGTMGRRELLAPAIRLAREGFVLGPGDIGILAEATYDFRRQPNVGAIFLHRGRPFEAGERLVQYRLARTLERLARDGAEVFYRGEIAREIVLASRTGGGRLSGEDLARYQVHERDPLRCAYRGHGIVSAPPPSSGGTTLCQILRILEGYPLGAFGFGDARTVHRMTEAMRHAFLDRNTHLGDPEYVDNPVAYLLSDAHAARIRGAISEVRATPSRALAPGVPPHEGVTTTHYSIVDGAGNAAAVTTTLNLHFGNKRIAGGTGFFLNSGLNDFAASPGAANSFGLVQGAANAIESGKRPLSSMAPTIVLRDGEPFLVTGGRDGPRIITTVLGMVLNIIDHGMGIGEAVAAPRIHHQWLPDRLVLEPAALSPRVRAELRGMGHRLEIDEPWGAAPSILIDPATGARHGVSDPRRSTGAAAGF